VARPQGASCDIGAVEGSPVTATTTTLASREDCGNCVDDDGDGRTDYEDPACCAQTAAMQVKTALIVPGPAGATKGHLSLTAILAQAGFADVDPTRDDVTVQLRNQNGELLRQHLSSALEAWESPGAVPIRGSHRNRGAGAPEDADQGLEERLGALPDRREEDGPRPLPRPELTATVRVGDRCSTATIALRSRKNKKFVYP